MKLLVSFLVLVVTVSAAPHLKYEGEAIVEGPKALIIGPSGSISADTGAIGRHFLARETLAAPLHASLFLERPTFYAAPAPAPYLAARTIINRPAALLPPPAPVITSRTTVLAPHIAPAPVVAPAPTYISPAPVVAPPPAYIAPAPVLAPTPTFTTRPLGLPTLFRSAVLEKPLPAHTLITEPILEKAFPAHEFVLDRAAGPAHAIFSSATRILGNPALTFASSPTFESQLRLPISEYCSEFPC